jgi:hypothetical protein
MCRKDDETTRSNDVALPAMEGNERYHSGLAAEAMKSSMPGAK